MFFEPKFGVDYISNYKERPYASREEAQNEFDQMARKCGKSSCKRIVTHREVGIMANKIADFLLRSPQRSDVENKPTLFISTNMLISPKGVEVGSDFHSKSLFYFSFDKMGMKEMTTANEMFGLTLALEQLIRKRIEQNHPRRSAKFTSKIGRFLGDVRLDIEFTINNPK